jgi:hypothetical protein
MDISVTNTGHRITIDVTHDEYEALERGLSKAIGRSTAPLDPDEREAMHDLYWSL